MVPKGASNLHEWIFGCRTTATLQSPCFVLLIEMPAIIELDLLEMGDPSECVLIEFCVWLAGNKSLKVLALPLRSWRNELSSRVLEELGFALFSQTSTLKLDRLTLDLEGLTANDVDHLHRGAERSSSATSAIEKSSTVRSQDTRHEALTLMTSTSPMATVTKFFELFGHHFRRLDLLRVMAELPWETYFRLVRLVVASCPQLIELIIPMVSVDDAIFDEKLDLELLPVAPKLCSLTIFDPSTGEAGRAMACVLELIGQKLTTLTIAAMGGTSVALADAIPALCPELTSLDISIAASSFMDRLLDAYASGTCKVSSLTLGIESHCPGTALTLIRRLVNITISNRGTLRKLVFTGCYFPNQMTDQFQDAQLKILDDNPSLVETDFPFCSPFLDVARTRNGNLVPNVAYPLHPRQRAAVLSCGPVVACGRVPRDIWRRILVFSARPARRSAAALI